MKGDEGCASLLLSQVRESIRQGSVGPEWGDPSILDDSDTMCTAQDLGLVISMLQPCNGSKEKTQLNSGG